MSDLENQENVENTENYISQEHNMTFCETKKFLTYNSDEQL